MPKTAAGGDVWQHFIPKRLATTGKVLTVKCRYCDYGRDGGKSANATRCWQHIITRHPSVNTEGATSSQSSCGSSVGPSVSELEWKDLNTKGPMDRHVDRRFSKVLTDRANDLLVRWQASLGIPFSAIDSAQFQAFVSCLRPDYKAPSRSTLGRMLSHEAALTGVRVCICLPHPMPSLICSQLFEKLDGCQHLALMVDGWQDHRHLECLGTVVVNMMDGCRKPYVFDVRQQRVRQTAENVASYIKEQIQKLSIHGARVLAVVSDSQGWFSLGNHPCVQRGQHASSHKWH